MATHDMRKKLQWLLVSRLVVAGALLLTVSVIEKEPSQRSFLPVLMAVTGVTALLSGFYFLAMRTRLPHRTLAYLELTLDVLTVTWLVALTSAWVVLETRLPPVVPVSDWSFSTWPETRTSRPAVMVAPLTKAAAMVWVKA